MCDYSLHGIKNRLAREGEPLVVHRFHTGSKGLTSPEYLEPSASPKGMLAFLKSMFAPVSQECAVCIPDGARLKLDGVAVTFRQLSEKSATYRDAVEFENGVKVRLQELEPGQRVEVLALSSEMSPLEQRFVRAGA